jgi:hypothetical protein
MHTGKALAVGAATALLLSGLVWILGIAASRWTAKRAEKRAAAAGAPMLSSVRPKNFSPVMHTEVEKTMFLA